MSTRPPTHRLLAILMIIGWLGFVSSLFIECIGQQTGGQLLVSLVMAWWYAPVMLIITPVGWMILMLPLAFVLAFLSPLLLWRTRPESGTYPLVLFLCGGLMILMFASEDMLGLSPGDLQIGGYLLAGSYFAMGLSLCTFRRQPKWRWSLLHCQKCGYDMRGNFKARRYQCPECGHLVPPSTSSKRCAGGANTGVRL